MEVIKKEFGKLPDNYNKQIQYSSTVMRITSEGRQNIENQWCFNFGASHGIPFVPQRDRVVVDLPYAGICGDVYERWKQVLEKTI